MVVSRKVWESGAMAAAQMDWDDPEITLGGYDDLGLPERATLAARTLSGLTVSPRVRYRVVLEELSDEEAGHAEG